MEIRLIRHATLLVTFHGRRLLVDPMLADAGTAPPVANSPNPRPNPLVPLPVPSGDVVAGVDAVLVTHTHRDHWDDAAAAALPKSLPLFCQTEDEEKFRGAGFTDVRPVRGVAHWDGIAIHRTGGQQTNRSSISPATPSGVPTSSRRCASTIPPSRSSTPAGRSFLKAARSR